MKSLQAISRPFTKSTSPPPPRDIPTPPRAGETSYTPSSPGPPRLDLQLGEPSDFSLGDLEISSFNEAKALNSTGGSSEPLPGPSALSPLPESPPAPLPSPPPQPLESVLYPEAGLSRPGLRSEPSEAALHLPALTPSVARRESEPTPITPGDPNLPPIPPNTTVNSPDPNPSGALVSFPHRPELQHSPSITSSPPDYSTLSPTRETPPFSSYHRPPSSPPSSNPRAVSVRNKEKQALRDTWAKQDAERQAYGNFYPFPVPQTAPAAPPLAQPGNTIQGFEPGNDGSGSSGSGGTQDRRLSSSVGGAVESRNVLPVGMDIRDALAKCEDPGLGWSLQFWVTIADPQTQNVFFACPASGQCSWDPPVGAMIVPRMPEGEWWELADASRGNRCYYYNTMTGKTQWTRPQGNAFVIPLGLIQQNALPKERPTDGSNVQSPDYLSPNRVPTSPPVTPNRQPAIPSRTSSANPASPSRPSVSPRKQPGRSPTRSADPTSADTPPNPPNGSGDRGFPSEPSQSTVASNTVLRTPLSVVDEGSGNETDVSESGSPGWWEKRKVKGPRLNRVNGKGREIGDLADMDRALPPDQEETLEGEALSAANRSAVVDPADPIPVYSVRTKRMSTGLHPLLPTSISDEIQAFQTEDFAAKYFATKRTGMLRSRVPFDEIMQWQKQPLTSPLLVISRSLAKDAITTFKVIQHVMGERDKPVDQAKPSLSTATALNTATKGKGRKDGVYALKLPNLSSAKVDGSRVHLSQLDGSNGVGFGQADGVDDKLVVLEEIRWMLQLAVGAGEMRDEVYSQLIKQLVRNPNHNAMVMGFQLFCILVNSFGPSKNFEAFVRRFLENDGRGTDGISRMAQYCLGRLDHMSRRGGRGRSLTIGEIEHAADAAFYPSVYGEPLDQIMSLQAPTYPDLKVPVILPFLADGILSLDGLKAEGIFRVPGDGDSVSELRSRMDRGYYVLTGIEDPHVAASLFKLWLRDLREPVIPEDLYNDALIASKSTEASLAFIERLPVLNRRVLLFVISFFQLFLKEEVVEITKMTPNNLALVLAPNILRTTSDHLVTVFTNSSFESRFTLQLLEHLDPQTVDPDYKPVHGR